MVTSSSITTRTVTVPRPQRRRSEIHAGQSEAHATGDSNMEELPVTCTPSLSSGDYSKDFENIRYEYIYIMKTLFEAELTTLFQQPQPSKTNRFISN